MIYRARQNRRISRRPRNLIHLPRQVAGALHRNRLEPVEFVAAGMIAVQDGGHSENQA
jgi:hypothetical protein